MKRFISELTGAAQWLPLELLLKSTVLLALAGLVALALRRAPAATRHLAWTAAVSALLLLPLLAPVLPRLPLPIPVGLVAGAVEWPRPVPAAGASGSEVPASAGVGAERPAGAAAERAGAASRWPGSERALVLLWLAGVLVVALWLLVGRIGLARLGRRAEVVEDPAWRSLLRDAGWALDVDAPVRLLRSPAATIPLTWGIRRPVLMLPADSGSWPEERRRVVLLHELAHVARRDALTQLVAGVACALYWFHPGVWLAARRLRVEREAACDDHVLSAGTPAPAYASHLIEVARSYRAFGPGSLVTVSMARPSHLEGRVLAVLDGARRRGRLSRRAGSLAAGLVAALVLPLAALRPAPSPVSRAEPLATGQEREASPPSPLALPQATPTFERSVPTKFGRQLTLDLATGGAVRIVGVAEEDVRVRAWLGGRDWRGTRVSVEPTPDGVRVEARQVGSAASSSTDHTFEIRVPRRYDVRLASAGGPVEISGVSGAFRGETGGGTVRLSRVDGSVQLGTGGGDVWVADSRVSGQVTTAGGEIIMIRSRGNLQGSGGAAASAAMGSAAAMASPGKAGAALGVTVAPGVAVVGGKVTASAPGTVTVSSSTAGGPGVVAVTTSHGEGYAVVSVSPALAAARGAVIAATDSSGFAYIQGDVAESRIEALRWMAESAPPQAAAAGLARIAFESREGAVRKAAVRLLGELRTPEAKAALRRIAREHRNAVTRRDAREQPDARP